MVEAAQQENRNLELSARNIKGLELVRGNTVHPYHLLRYERAIFSQNALNKLQDSLRKTASRREHAAAPKKTARKKQKAEVA